MKQECEMGIVGLGVMGRNFLLNLADHNFSVAGFDIDINKVNFHDENSLSRIHTTGKIDEFVSLLRQPRVVMLLVPAGSPVDSAINNLLNYLQPGDIIIDAGNSYFKDTDRRIHELEARNILFMGTGISGGEEGARKGPSIMPGGSRKAWERVRPMFEAAAARENNLPCVSLLGSGSSGHFVKMVHNGIEYGIMQLIAETYDIMKRGFKMNDDQLHDVYNDWTKSELNSYLLGITADIFSVMDEESGEKLVNMILDKADQKGTGMWTSCSAMDLKVPVPTIDAAVMMRNLSVSRDQRQLIGRTLDISIKSIKGADHLKKLKYALFTGMIITYTQGMALLYVASSEHGYGLNLIEVSRVWKGGCIIRSEFLNDIFDAFSGRPDLPNLLLDKNISRKIIEFSPFLREVIALASGMGIAAPCMMSSLAYLDAISSGWLPANLVQAQRDYFGAHTYERVDEKGSFHTDWLNIKVHENISH